ncbi:uncharacterized protein DUF1700 [Natranaerovirga hydrolytica]|uniref:Uncharacterized protein DUF1700 n=1 Tax=Natranaerovirga hydrolytica TaxID=680378 RepID=A0A4R1M9F0_9FIRM|nr:DUF1700 domain-containing protein [Natranaerovirga hydrolytica]TCK88042.1 uncharacterized protein DUF1700 [Natranaerovirga hydrolytica]
MKGKTKGLYLQELRRGLKFKYRKDEINNILEDYNEYFEVGMAQGKSETQIYLELDDPIQVIQNLKRENPPMSIFKIKEITRYIRVILPIVTWLLMINRINDRTHVLGDVIFIFPVSIICLGILLKKISCNNNLDNKENKSSLKLRGIHTVTLIIAIVSFVTMIFGKQLSEGFAINKSQVGPYVTYVLYIAMVLLGGLMIYGFYQTQKNTVFFGSVIHIIGVLFIITNYISLLYSVIEVNAFQKKVVENVLLYIVTIVAVGIFSVYRNRKRG